MKGIPSPPISLGLATGLAATLVFDVIAWRQSDATPAWLVVGCAISSCFVPAVLAWLLTRRARHAALTVVSRGAWARD